VSRRFKPPRCDLKVILQNRHLAGLKRQGCRVTPHRGQVVEQVVFRVRPPAPTGLRSQIRVEIRAIPRLQTLHRVAVDAKAACSRTKRIAELAHKTLYLYFKLGHTSSDCAHDFAACLNDSGRRTEQMNGQNARPMTFNDTDAYGQGWSQFLFALTWSVTAIG
jgi:hypothetical protein